MQLSKGDIVLVPFPFSDFTQTKLRPAVILWVDLKGQDVTLCFISSQSLSETSDDEFVINSNDPEFSLTGLKLTSKVKVSKIITLERKLLRRRLGKLGEQQLNLLNQTLVKVFDLK
ncbi:MAG: type II toxin-antitoxin system PemK/MazF family toxin [Halothece sp. Uz-M2-17]|nr:type II toxin-antitoxin system PemK/MazF family toxin [Halothece sp. Uz-M2-17]